ncbi:MAG: sensor histidine kinase [Kiritimatiellia bacterium]|nr:sensor histidine kinase [Kiritimatiellia bacterium]
MTSLPILLAVLASAADIVGAIESAALGEDFDLTAVVSAYSAKERDFAIDDRSGAAIVSNGIGRRLEIGDVVHMRGIIRRTARDGHIHAWCTQIERLGKAPVPSPAKCSIHDVISGGYDARVVQVTGELRDCFRDEIDSNIIYMILNQDDKSLYLAMPFDPESPTHRLESMLWRKVTVTGICDPRPSGSRRKIGRIIRIHDECALVPCDEKPIDPFDVPSIGNPNRIQPSEIARLGRRRISGQVIAVWHGESILLKTEDGNISRVDLFKPEPPLCGDMVEAVGFPATDLYRINLTKAIWRTTGDRREYSQPATNITAKTLVAHSHGRATFQAHFHGATVRLRGIVRALPGVGDGNERLYIEDDGCLLPVDVGDCPEALDGISLDCLVEITAICVMDIENWSPNHFFPHIKEELLVVRSAGDIVVLRRPSWWTPAKLLVVIGSLLVTLVAILIWNRSLHALARKRGKDLANEEIERLESDLKVLERTRLAVELHDSVAQNLTGVSMEIDSGLRCSGKLPPEATSHFTRAVRMLGSCRTELRNCLWDLRNQALEENDMDNAIRLTLSPAIGKTDLRIRFSVPRSSLTDNTAHAILRIIRELATNAVRHGRATTIWIAGSIEGDTMMFSVRDNGIGFNPHDAPGVLQGHFGLQGIRERVASFEGSMTVESKTGHGTKVTISIKAVRDEDKEKI